MRFGIDETHCRSCQELYPTSDLDRYLWCPSCRKALGRRGAVWGRAVGLAAGLGVALYVALVISPPRLRLLWAVPPLLTYVLASRIAVAVVQGYYRARGRVAPTAGDRS